MLRAAIRFLIASMIVLGFFPERGAIAQTSNVMGGDETFRLYCAPCHGTSARGDGPVASSMRQKPADLTLLAQRNGGTFAADEVARIIDGRNPVKGHGGGDMPVWGDAFAKTADPTPVDEKIRRVVAYLRTIQAKP